MARTVFRYKTYNFINKDPVIDLLRTATEDTGSTIASLSEDSNVSNTTLYNWFHGDTKRPQFATVAAVAVALGVRSIGLNAGKPQLMGYTIKPRAEQKSLTKRRKKAARA